MRCIKKAHNLGDTIRIFSQSRKKAPVDTEVNRPKIVTLSEGLGDGIREYKRLAMLMYWNHDIGLANAIIESKQEQNKNELERVSSPEESRMAKSSSNFPIVDRKDYHIAEKTIHYIQVNHVIEKPKTKNAEAKEKLEKAEFNFMIYLKTLIHKTSVDPKLLTLKLCVRNKQKERAPEQFCPVFSKIPERFGLLFAGDRIVVPEESKRPVVDALDFGHLGSRKMLAESNINWWSGMKENIKKNSAHARHAWVLLRT